MQNQANLKSFAKENWVPILRDKSTDFISEICKKQNPKKILEIGTAIGYSGTVMLEAAPNATLTTIELNEDNFNKAIETFATNGLQSRVNVILGDAIEVLPRLVAENKQYDFIFLDGPKAQYFRYLPILKKLLTVQGTLVADNIYFHGMVKASTDPGHKHRSLVRNLRIFIEMLEKDADFETTFLDIDDGISVSRLK